MPPALDPNHRFELTPVTIGGLVVLVGIISSVATYAIGFGQWRGQYEAMAAESSRRILASEVRITLLETQASERAAQMAAIKESLDWIKGALSQIQRQQHLPPILEPSQSR